MDYFLERFAKLYQKEKATFSSEAMEYLISHVWPGNVRQLKNLIERVFLTTSGQIIHQEDFPEDFIEEAFDQRLNRVQESHETKNTSSLLPSAGVEPLRKARERLERSLILTALQMTNGQRSKAADMLEIKPRTLRQKISDYGIEFRKTRKRIITKSQANKREQL